MTYGQDYLSSRELANTFKIKFDKHSGTTFLIDFNNENYYVTARHLFPKQKANDTVEIELVHNSISKTIKGILLFHKKAQIDIAVIKPINKAPLIKAFSLENRPMTIGDNGFFLGYPLDLHTIGANDINNGFPLALVKRANLSGTRVMDDIVVHLLDGHNNPGFSGGPIVFKDRTKPSDHIWYLAGVVVAYYNQNKQTNFGSSILNYDENSGIIVSYGTRHIIEIVENK